MVYWKTSWLRALVHSNIWFTCTIGTGACAAAGSFFTVLAGFIGQLIYSLKHALYWPWYMCIYWTTTINNKQNDASQKLLRSDVQICLPYILSFGKKKGMKAATFPTWVSRSIHCDSNFAPAIKNDIELSRIHLHVYSTKHILFETLFHRDFHTIHISFCLHMFCEYKIWNNHFTKVFPMTYHMHNSNSFINVGWVWKVMYMYTFNCYAHLSYLESKTICSVMNKHINHIIPIACCTEQFLKLLGRNPQSHFDLSKNFETQP